MHPKSPLGPPAFFLFFAGAFPSPAPCILGVKTGRTLPSSSEVPGRYLTDEHHEKLLVTAQTAAGCFPGTLDSPSSSSLPFSLEFSIEIITFHVLFPLSATSLSSCFQLLLFMRNVLLFTYRSFLSSPERLGVYP